MKQKKRSKIISILTALGLMLTSVSLYSDLYSEPGAYECRGKKVVSVEDYNNCVLDFNDCRDRLAEKQRILEDTLIAIDNMKAENRKAKLKYFGYGAGIGAGLGVIVSVIIFVKFK